MITVYQKAKPSKEFKRGDLFEYTPGDGSGNSSVFLVTYVNEEAGTMNAVCMETDLLGTIVKDIAIDDDVTICPNGSSIIIAQE